METLTSTLPDTLRENFGSTILERSELSLVVQMGVIGGEFRAVLAGQRLAQPGKVQVTISCTRWQPTTSTRNSASSPDTCFLEVEKFEPNDSRLDIQFLIPFESKGSNEDATWHLTVEFEDNFCESFEVPIFRTDESNPEINEVAIAAFGFGVDESSTHTSPKSPAQLPNNGRQKPYELDYEENSLRLRIPSRVAGGGPSLAPGLGALCGLWAAATFGAYWVFAGDIEPVIILGIPLLAFTVLLAFVLFGESHIELDEDQMVIRHRVFGLSIPKRVPRSDVTGFATTCLGSLPSKRESQPSYIVTAQKQGLFLSYGLLNRNDSRTVAKRLNDFWDVTG